MSWYTPHITYGCISPSESHSLPIWLHTVGPFIHGIHKPDTSKRKVYIHNSWWCFHAAPNRQVNPHQWLTVSHVTQPLIQCFWWTKIVNLEQSYINLVFFQCWISAFFGIARRPILSSVIADKIIHIYRVGGPNLSLKLSDFGLHFEDWCYMYDQVSNIRHNNSQT